MRNEGKPNVAHNADGEIEAEFDELPQTGMQTVRAGSAMQVKTQYTTAVHVQRPRDLASNAPTSVLNRVLREAEICGEDFIYSMTFKSREGPSVVEGVSIDGAMVMARNYGNCATDVEIVEDAPQHWVLRAVFIDLETGFTEPRLFRQGKGATQGKFDAERKLDIAFQIGQSKAKRNVIVRSMPVWLVTKAVEAAKAAAAAAIKNLPEAIDWVVKTFGGMGVDIPRLERRIGAPQAQWNARDVVRMKATYKAIRDRQTTIADEFPSVEAVPSPTPSTTATPETPATAPTEPAPAAAPAATHPASVTQPAAAPAPAPTAAAPPATEAKPAEPPATPSPAPTAAPDASKGKAEKKRDREPGEDG